MEPKEKSKGTILPDEDHVMRYVSWTKLRKDEDNRIIGFLPQAFELRPTETSLSVNWLEYFQGDRVSQIRDSVRLFRNTYDVKPKSAFGIGNIGKIRETCSAAGTRVRIVYDPTKDNKSHAVVRNLLREEQSLLDALAADAFVELIHNTDIH